MPGDLFQPVSSHPSRPDHRPREHVLVVMCDDHVVDFTFGDPLVGIRGEACGKQCLHRFRLPVGRQATIIIVRKTGITHASDHNDAADDGRPLRKAAEGRRAAGATCIHPAPNQRGHCGEHLAAMPQQPAMQVGFGKQPPVSVFSANMSEMRRVRGSTSGRKVRPMLAEMLNSISLGSFKSALPSVLSRLRAANILLVIAPMKQASWMWP